MDKCLVYGRKFGFVLRHAKEFLRKAGRTHGCRLWHRFIRGINKAGGTIVVCLGVADPETIHVWIKSHNGYYARLARALFDWALEHMTARACVRMVWYGVGRV